MAIYGPRWPLKIGNEDTYELYSTLKDQINFYLDYTSATTVRCIFSVLLLLKTFSRNSVVVNWYYNALDESVKETIEDLIPLVPYKFNLIPEEF